MDWIYRTALMALIGIIGWGGKVSFESYLRNESTKQMQDARRDSTLSYMQSLIYEVKYDGERTNLNVIEVSKKVDKLEVQVDESAEELARIINDNKQYKVSYFSPRL
jgi:hypothetical protein